MTQTATIINIRLLRPQLASTSASNCLERLVSEISSGTLNSSHSLALQSNPFTEIIFYNSATIPNFKKHVWLFTVASEVIRIYVITLNAIYSYREIEVYVKIGCYFCKLSILTQQLTPLVG